MISERNEGIYNGGGYGGYGGDGILGLIALMSLFRKDFYGGNYDGAAVNLATIEGQLSNVRADIGDVKYDNVSSILSQTNALMAELCNGRMENISAILNQTNALQGAIFGLHSSVDNVKFDIGSQMCSGFNGINQNILNQGFQNQLSNERQTNALSSQLSECCCSTKGLIQETAFATQLRDLENKCSTDKQLVELAAGQKAIMSKIDESRLLDENSRLKERVEALRERNDRNFLSNEIASTANRNIAATYGHWWADRAFNGETYPQPPYPGSYAYY